MSWSQPCKKRMIFLRVAHHDNLHKLSQLKLIFEA